MDEKQRLEVLQMTERVRKRQIARVVQAAQDLEKNWDEGAMARAMYRDALVAQMVDAGLLPASVLDE